VFSKHRTDGLSQLAAAAGASALPELEVLQALCDDDPEPAVPQTGTPEPLEQMAVVRIHIELPFIVPILWDLHTEE